MSAILPPVPHLLDVPLQVVVLPRIKRVKMGRRGIKVKGEIHSLHTDKPYIIISTCVYTYSTPIHTVYIP